METSFNTSEEWYSHFQNPSNIAEFNQRIFLCLEFIAFCTREECAYILYELREAAKKRRFDKQESVRMVTSLLLRCVHTLTKEKTYYALKNGAVYSNVSPLSFRSISADSEAEAAEFLEYVYTG